VPKAGGWLVGQLEGFWVASGDNNARIWDADSGKEIALQKATPIRYGASSPAPLVPGLIGFVTSLPS
jgi:hypothetical protein